MRMINMKNKNKGMNMTPLAQIKSRDFTHRCGMLAIVAKIPALRTSLKF
jgi:hypothetical protein